MLLANTDTRRNSVESWRRPWLLNSQPARDPAGDLGALHRAGGAAADSGPEGHVDAVHARMRGQITVGAEGGGERVELPLAQPVARGKTLPEEDDQVAAVGVVEPARRRLPTGERALDRPLAVHRPAGEQIAQSGGEILMPRRHIDVDQATTGYGVGQGPLRQDLPLGISGQQPLVAEQDVGFEQGMNGGHAMIADQGHHRRPQVERAEQPGELAVRRLPDPAARGLEGLAPLGGEARLARIAELELMPDLVDRRDVAQQEIPGRTLRHGDQAVAEEAGEPVGLLDPGLKVDAGAAEPGVA